MTDRAREISATTWQWYKSIETRSVQKRYGRKHCKKSKSFRSSIKELRTILLL